jgi:very-short-patch-repair endonuclease
MRTTAKTAKARRLRRNQTDAERILWLCLRDRKLDGLKFRRQVPIDRYVVDFLCPDSYLVVEVDGSRRATADEISRSRTQEAMGCLVLRFWNNEVHENIDGVLQPILDILDRSEPPHPDPLPCGERESARAAMPGTTRFAGPYLSP